MGYTLAVAMQIDLHGYHPKEIVWNGVLLELIKQTWEIGERELILIHGHGRNRGITLGFVNTNTGFLGLEIRGALRHDERLRQSIHHTALDCCRPGDNSCARSAVERRPEKAFSQRSKSMTLCWWVRRTPI